MSQAVLDAVRAESQTTRRLTPANTKIHRADHGVLCARIEDEDTRPAVLYQGVFATLAFPISSPDSFVSLQYRPSEDRQQEIGMIESLAQFDRETADLLKDSLAGHYFEFQIARVKSVVLKWGLLLFDVMTRQGPRRFEMRWSDDRTQDIGEHGKVLLDVHGNRYVIDDMRKLPREDRARLTHYIYW